MKNKHIADKLREMALLLELDGADLFIIDEWRRAVRIINSLEPDACAMETAQLAAMQGLSPAIAARVSEICSLGVFDALAELRAKYPPGICALLKINGIGPGRAKQLYYTLSIKSPEELKSAIETGALNGADGFGPNALRTIAEGLSIRLKTEGRMLWFNAYELARDAVDFVRQCRAEDALVCGAVRTGEETVEKIVIVFSAPDPEAVFLKFAYFDNTVPLSDSLEYRRLYRLQDTVDCELVYAGPGKLPFYELFETGAQAHLDGLKEIAAGRGLELDTDGLRRRDSLAPVICRDEKDIYAALGLQFVPPELRTGSGELDAARSFSLPELITRADILGEFHNHTLYSDGSCPFDVMLTRALKEGYKWIFLGDHSHEVRVTRGLDYKAFMSSRKELETVAAQFPGLRVSRSLEVEIFNDGRIDFNHNQLMNIPFAVASVHSGFELDAERMTARIVRAVSTPGVDAFAHPTGRIIGRRNGYTFDFQAVAAACAAHGTAMEINAQPDRQDLTPANVCAAKKLGCKFIISTDAHSSQDLRFIQQGVTIARRAGLTRDDVLNTLPFERISKLTGKSA